MSYNLKFKTEALREWRRLDHSIRLQFKKKLTARLLDPVVPAARLTGARNRFKIKLRATGYRLVYEVREQKLTVVVIAVGKRERNAAYHKAAKRQ